MSDHITLEVVDVDGAIQEAHEDLDMDTRGGFFKKAALGGASVEDEFYEQAIQNGTPTGDVLAAAQIVSHHENEHVAFLRKALGRAAVKKPTFDFKDTVTDPAKFLATAVALEDTGFITG